MNDILKGLIIALIPAAAVAVLTAKLTVNLSVEQFRTQKWWEKKSEAYSKIVSCLSSLLYCYREWVKEYDDGNPRKMSDAKKGSLSGKYNQSMEEFHEAANSSVFNISEKAADAVLKLRDELEYEFDSINWFEDAKYYCELVENCIKDIKVYAREDLKLKKI